MLEFACKVFKVFTSLRSKKFKTFDTLKTLCSCKLDLENIYDTSARSETQHLHSFYKMLQHSPTFRSGKELELMLKTLNAWKTLHCRDFRILSTLRSTCGKYIDIT